MIRVLVLCCMLAACSTEVQIHHLQNAQELCKSHGGVSRMWSDLSFWHAQCIDGTRHYKAGERG